MFSESSAGEGGRLGEAPLPVPLCRYSLMRGVPAAVSSERRLYRLRAGRCSRIGVSPVSERKRMFSLRKAILGAKKAG